MENNEISINTMPEIMNAADLTKLLRISRASAYNLLNSEGFPTLHIGCRLLVRKEHLLAWLNSHTDRIDDMQQKELMRCR